MRILQVLSLLCIVPVLAPMVRTQVSIDRLRDQLRQPGPDAREQREAAIDALLGSADERAHAVLQERLAMPPDADGAATTILRSLTRRLRNAQDPVFGTAADPAVRSRVIAGYLPALAALWRGEADADGVLPPDPMRADARACLVRMPVADLDQGLRSWFAGRAEPGDRLAVLRCAADSQQLVLGRFLAEQLDATDPAVRSAAHQGLRLLTFVADGFASLADFSAWFEQNKDQRYLDLAEQAARRHLRGAALLRAESDALRRQAVVDFVRLHVERRPGIDWAAIEARVLGPDAAAAAGLEQLRLSLATAPITDDPGPGRGAFLRTLLQRLGDGSRKEHATVLEIAGHLARPEDGDLQSAVQQQLLAALASPQPALQLAAVRGLRRSPGPETRAAVIRFAQAMQRQDPPMRAHLEAALATLSCRAPKWCAPDEQDPAHAEWVALLRQVLLDPAAAELRDEALALALLPDERGVRDADAFMLLLTLAKDPAVDAEFRAVCLLHLQDWREDRLHANRWVTEITALLSDSSQEVRLFAANALATLPEVVDRQNAWRQQVTVAMRERLPVEVSPTVVRAMAECLVGYAQQPEASAAVIAALNVALEPVPGAVPAEQVPRVEPLLQALTTVAVDPRTDQGQWLRACETLQKFQKRRSLRHVLTSHDAAALLSEDAANDGTVPNKVAKAILGTALLRTGREAWNSTDDLKAEAQDVRSAFAALGNSSLLLQPALRLLRIEVDLAANKTKEVVAQALACLQPGPDDGNVAAFAAAERDAVRLLLAEAYLLENKLDPAAQALAQRDPSALDARSIEVMERLGRALTASDAAAAVGWLDRVVKATSDGDPAFRGRFLAWATAASQADPAGRSGLVAELDRRAPLFETADCPVELKEAFASLRGVR